MVSITGWTWEYIDAHMTLPRLYAMHRSWETLPPPAIQLARIASFFGINLEPKEEVGTLDDFIVAMGGVGK